MSTLSMLLGLATAPVPPKPRRSSEAADSPCKPYQRRGRLKEGQVIAGATLIARLSPEGLHAEQTLWRCRCSCGAEFERLETWIRPHGKGAVRCGRACPDRSRRPPGENLIGRRFGSLTIIAKKPEVVKGRGTVWEYRCDCGNVGFRPTRELNDRGVKQRCMKGCSYWQGKGEVNHGLGLSI